MAKKIYDIKPPEVPKKRAPRAVKAVGVVKVVKKTPVPKTPKQVIPPVTPSVADLPPKVRKFPTRAIIVGCTIVGFVLMFYLYNKLPKTDISIWPTTDTVTLNAQITADKDANVVDMAKKIIPAQYVELQKDDWQEFPATGSATNDGKASGSITIYNKISPATTFTLKTGTHFLSDSGKYFITLAKVVVPAASGKNPGSITVNVQAEESGPGYNIKASKFSVPKLSGTAYYYSIWGESTEAMSGGYTGNVKKVTGDDISFAKDTLTKKLLDQAEESLKSRFTADDVLIDGAISKEVIDSSASVKSGAIVDKFDEQAKVKVSAVVFKKQDLDKFIKDYATSKLREDKNLLEKSMELVSEPEKVDVAGGSETLNLKMTFKTYYKIDTDELVNLLAAKTSPEVKGIVDQMYEGKISKLGVSFWPFWVRKSPNDNNRIKVNLDFE